MWLRWVMFKLKDISTIFGINKEASEHGTPVFEKQSTVSIGDVAVSRSDPKIIWVGTGEHNARNSVSWGDGVYKSTDAGKTWKNMGLKKSFQTGRIAIHPTNPDIVYVGALGRLWGPNEERGVYKTTDGGKSWKKILHVSRNYTRLALALGKLFKKLNLNSKAQEVS